VYRVKEAPLVTGKQTLEGRRGALERRHREVGCSFDTAFSPCAVPGEAIVDGFVLCERHATEARLEGQIDCWGGMLFHVDLWSREAGRRNRPGIVELLGIQRAQVTSAIERARADLDRVREGVTLTGDIPLRPPGYDRRPSRGLRRLRRG
jgi:hypothetical protein